MKMADETRERIIDATMNLIMDRGYSQTTTKDIASKAGVNECTIFRKFKGKNCRNGIRIYKGATLQHTAAT